MCYRRGDQSTNFSAVAHVDKEPRLEEVRRRQWKRLFAETSLRPATAGLLAVPLIPDEAMPTVLAPIPGSPVAWTERDRAPDSESVLRPAISPTLLHRTSSGGSPALRWPT